jgi:hypothetical protein
MKNAAAASSSALGISFTSRICKISTSLSPLRWPLQRGYDPAQRQRCATSNRQAGRSSFTAMAASHSNLAFLNLPLPSPHTAQTVYPNWLDRLTGIAQPA